MYKPFPIVALCLLSCGHDTSRQTQISQAIDTVPEVRLDSNYPGKDAFDWDWEKPTEKIVLSSTIIKYIAKGHEPIDTFAGDINEDNLKDLVVVTGILKEDSLRYKNGDLPRHLLIFLGQKNNQYKFSFRNEKVIPCIGCCGMTDPYGGMSVKKGQIVINEYCASNWKSISEYRFLYNPKLNDWLLDTIISESYAFDHEYYNLDTTTKKDFGKVSIKTFVMYKDDERF